MKTRSALCAGSFYPAGKLQLEIMIEKLLKENKPDFKKIKLGSKKIDLKKVRAAIVPHAGYVYSGEIASLVYNTIKEIKPKSVCVIGPAHQDRVEGVVTFKEYWATPFGKTECVPLPKLKVISNDNEHCIEVQLPFLQTVLGVESFEFIPALYGEITPSDLAEKISPIIDHSLLIASSDLSHYLPYEQAKVVDRITIDSIISLDTKTLVEKGDACGITGIAALCLIAKEKGWKPVFLNYKNSGDTSGNKRGVVGYVAIIFIE